MVITLQTVFTNKTIINGVKKDKLEKFVTFLLEQIWVNSEIPGTARKVRESKHPSVAALYKAFDVDSAVKRGIARGAIHIDMIGQIEIGLQMKINVVDNTATPFTQIEIDKFMYERDNRSKNLVKILLSMLETWKKLDVE